MTVGDVHGHESIFLTIQGCLDAGCIRPLAGHLAASDGDGSVWRSVRRGAYRDTAEGRFKKQTQGGTTWFLYSDEGLIAELDSTGNPTRYYGWKPNGLWGADPLWLAERGSNKSNNPDDSGGSGKSNSPSGSSNPKTPSAWKNYLYHNDHLWTPQRLTNTQGETQWSARSEAFGRTAAIINAINNPLRFPGQYEDEQGLHYNWNRDYSPSLGRYVQSDPVKFDGG